MAVELSLTFPNPAEVQVGLIIDGAVQPSAPARPFAPPLDAEAQRDLHWYLELYAAAYTADLDDARAAKIAARLPEWGGALFTAVFADAQAHRLFTRFQDKGGEGRLITIDSGDPGVLAQPWEMLCDPAGTFLFLDNPRISVRRRLTGAGGGREPVRVEAKDRVHLLFVISRPSDQSFIDPLSDARAVLDAIEAHAPGRVTWEVLRPPTRDRLIARLEDTARPAVDILHFDGHGVYDPNGESPPAGGGGSGGHLLKAGGGQGFLLFEDKDGEGDAVSASMLGEIMNRRKVGLVVLSACQSAKVGGDDPMGGVAARLCHAGLPAVLAMTHSVLVATTEALFGPFYGALARGRAIGVALDTARMMLRQHPERGLRQREHGPITLKLQDWFVPALYEAAADSPLLTAATLPPPPAVRRDNLRAPAESGFHGRSRERWDIERWLASATRRLVLSGFGGQGKTALAEESGRWLLRTGLFERVCFVDYASFQGVDPVGVAVSTLATVLERNLIDAEAATTALAGVPTLLILDNLESLTGAPLQELLSAAERWSEAGSSRVLVTTRMAGFDHPAWPSQGSLRCRHLSLGGLDPDDAVKCFQALVKLPPEPTVPLPEREPLKTLFARVDFHPLSIDLLSRELKSRRIAEIDARLDTILRSETDKLHASLTLSLDRLDPTSRALLPRLAIFQGGAWEPVLRHLCGLDAAQWSVLRQDLLRTGLIRAESLPGGQPPFLRFHPTLASVLAVKLTEVERQPLAEGHRLAYYRLSRELYELDKTAPESARAVVRRELANLLAAVHGALAAGDEDAVDFADNVQRFLGAFGLRRDRDDLSRRARATAGAEGSCGWYTAEFNHAEQLFAGGHYAEAGIVFTAILDSLGAAPSQARCVNICGLARCRRLEGQGATAVTLFRQAVAEWESLEATREVRRLLSVLQIDLGSVLADLGHYDEARERYDQGFMIASSLADQHTMAVARTQTGILALQMGDLVAAEEAFLDARVGFNRLDEPASEAEACRKLGQVYRAARQWPKAERAYREAARINAGNPLGAAHSWHDLAQLMDAGGRSDEAEAWYRKVLVVYQGERDRLNAARVLNNLASLLMGLPRRLPDAYSAAEEALAIKDRLDPVAAEIWTTYWILACIAERAGDETAARSRRRRSRDSYAATPFAAEIRRRRGPSIAAISAAARDPSLRPAVEQQFAAADSSWTKLVAALRSILDGARDEATLVEPLGYEEAVIVTAILRALDAPEAAPAPAA